MVMKAFGTEAISYFMDPHLLSYNGENQAQQKPSSQINE